MINACRLTSDATRRSGLSTLLIAVFVVACLFSALPSAATAATKTYVKGSPASLCTGTGAAAAECGEIRGVAVDQSNGNVYLLDLGNKRIDEFSSSGSFIRAFGVSVGGTGINVCTTTCQVGATTGAGAIGTGPHGIAIDSSTHIVYAVVGAAKVAYYEGDGTFLGEFTGTVGNSPVAPSVFAAVTGIAVDESSASHYVYVVTGASPNAAIDKFTVPTASGGTVTAVPGFQCQITGKETASATECAGSASKDGAFNGIEHAGQLGGDLSVDSAGNVYLAETVSRNVVSEFSSSGVFVRAVSATAPVAVAVGASNHIFVVDGGTANGGSKVQEFEVSTAMPISEFTIEGLSIGLGTYKGGSGLNGTITIGTKEKGKAWVYRELIEVAPEVEITPVTSISSTEAEAKGIVKVPADEGEGVPTNYHFEYKAEGSVTWISAPPSGEASAGSTPGSVMVSQQLTGLQPSKSYRVRLCATTSPGSPCTNTKVSAASEELTFETLSAPPTVRYELGANPLTSVVNPFGPTSARLAGYVNPDNGATHYRFEYGTTTAYGSQVPAEFEPILPAVYEELVVKATLSGLQPLTIYHYRIAASNASGTTFGADHQFTTAQIPPALDSSGLPDDRAFELVSSGEKGPVAEAGEQIIAASLGLRSQIDPSGEGIAYTVTPSLSESTTGGEVLYRSTHGAGAWASEQVSPAAPAKRELAGISNYYTTPQFLSRDLSCGFFSSGQPLTEDPAGEAALEAGGSNLYRRNTDGSWTLVNPPPTNPSIAATATTTSLTFYRVIGASEDCSRVYFATPYQFAGVAASGVYEWSEGTLRDASVIPGPSGPQSTTTTKVPVGEAVLLWLPWNEVPTDGKSLFFSATSANGSDAGKQAVFVRTNGATAVDASQSQTSTSNNGLSAYQMASRDGGRVFFTARYGLASNATSSGTSICSASQVGSNGLITGTGEGCDLYSYDAGTGELLDVSADSNPADAKGAGVLRVINASEDGSYVYYEARGQLTPGQGRTEAQNLTGSGSYNVYVAHIVGTTVATSYVGFISSSEATNPGISIQTASVTPNGRYFLFQTAEPTTGYASGGAREAYLYSAAANSTVCISCRTDGLPSVAEPNFNPLSILKGGQNQAAKINVNTALSADGRRAYFFSRDALVPGAEEGGKNLYQWEDGQVSLITIETPGQSTAKPILLLGTSESGDDVFFTSKRELSPWDTDERLDVYDVRVGGGFPSPPTPITPCDPLTEGACSGAQSPSSPSPSMPASSTLSGSGNPPPPPAPPKKKQKQKKKKKKSKHHKKKSKTAKHAKRVDKKGRAGK